MLAPRPWRLACDRRRTKGLAWPKSLRCFQVDVFRHLFDGKRALSLVWASLCDQQIIDFRRRLDNEEMLSEARQHWIELENIAVHDHQHDYKQRIHGEDHR